MIGRSFAAGTPLALVVTDLATAAEVPIDASRVVGITSAPMPLLGSPARLLGEVCREYNYRYQILDGIIIVVPMGEPIDSITVPLINKSTGMRGVPTSDLEKKIVKVTAVTKLSALLRPGALCVIETESTLGSRKAPIKARGTYLIERAVSSCDRKTSTTTVTGREYAAN